MQVVVALVVTTDGLPLAYEMLPQEGEQYVLAHSAVRVGKERAMRQRRLKTYWRRLGELAGQELARDELLQKLGAARDRAGRVVAGLVRVTVPAAGALAYQLDRAKLRAVRKREGRYLLRTNLSADDPTLVWRCYTDRI